MYLGFHLAESFRQCAILFYWCITDTVWNLNPWNWKIKTLFNVHSLIKALQSFMLWNIFVCLPSFFQRCYFRIFPKDRCSSQKIGIASNGFPQRFGFPELRKVLGKKIYLFWSPCKTNICVYGTLLRFYSVSQSGYHRRRVFLQAWLQLSILVFLVS